MNPETASYLGIASAIVGGLVGCVAWFRYVRKNIAELRLNSLLVNFMTVGGGLAGYVVGQIANYRLTVAFAP